jgi:hypothetical protein
MASERHPVGRVGGWIPDRIRIATNQPRQFAYQVDENIVDDVVAVGTSTGPVSAARQGANSGAELVRASGSR